MQNVVKDIFGEPISATSLNFLLLLVERGRVAILDGIAQKFLELSYEEAREEVYGMPYSEWKGKFQKPATEEQLAAFNAARSGRLVGGCTQSS